MPIRCDFNDAAKTIHRLGAPAAPPQDHAARLVCERRIGGKGRGAIQSLGRLIKPPQLGQGDGQEIMGVGVIRLALSSLLEG